MFTIPSLKKQWENLSNEADVVGALQGGKNFRKRTDFFDNYISKHFDFANRPKEIQDLIVKDIFGSKLSGVQDQVSMMDLNGDGQLNAIRGQLEKEDIDDAIAMQEAKDSPITSNFINAATNYIDAHSPVDVSKWLGGDTNELGRSWERTMKAAKLSVADTTTGKALGIIGSFGGV
jgi:hypothetical protein